MKNPSNEEKADTAKQAAKNWQIQVTSNTGDVCVWKKNSDMNSIACLLMKEFKVLFFKLYSSYWTKNGGLDMAYKTNE